MVTADLLLVSRPGSTCVCEQANDQNEGVGTGYTDATKDALYK